MRALTTVWIQKLDKDTLKRFYKNWVQSKKKAFNKYSENYNKENNIDVQLNRIKKYW